jgi:hypothetical protein
MESFKKLLTICILFSAVSVGGFAFAKEAKVSTCHCAKKTQYNVKLPESHPDNRCAVQNTAEVNWVDWLLGSSHSVQFHFVDLLELLSSDNAQQMQSNTIESN